MTELDMTSNEFVIIWPIENDQWNLADTPTTCVGVPALQLTMSLAIIVFYSYVIVV